MGFYTLNFRVAVELEADDDKAAKRIAQVTRERIQEELYDEDEGEYVDGKVDVSDIDIEIDSIMSQKDGRGVEPK